LRNSEEKSDAANDFLLRVVPLSGRTALVNHFQVKANFIWSIADLLRGDYKQSEYGRVILPFTLLRRLDGRANAKTIFVEEAAGSHDNSRDAARSIGRYLESLPRLTREILECSKFTEQVSRLRKAGLLHLVVGRFAEIDLSPRTVPNHEMGYIFEELIRKFSEQSNETAGEHFTPREVIGLMVRLLFAEGYSHGKTGSAIKTLYDPACGTGGMLSVAEEYVREKHPPARVEVYGQELNAESYAICKADTMLRGHDPSHIALGNSFLDDAFRGHRFDYMLTNPPFGVDWRKAEVQIREEHERLGFDGRFGAGLPRVNDGSLLFLQHMLAKMKPKGTRIAVVFNASPLFAGEAGSGESEIRRWILENDWLEAIVALPDQLFYNTTLATYIWVLTNHKSSRRRGKVQLIHAAGFYEKMSRSLGSKRNQISLDHITQIASIHRNFEENRHSKIFDNADFGYQRITVERPMRLNYQTSLERLNTVEERFEPAVVEILRNMDPNVVHRNASSFDSALANVFRDAGVKLSRTLARRLREALSEQDDSAEVSLDSRGALMPDPDLRDTEQLPLGADPHAWLETHVRPQAPDAWLDDAKTRTGYEIPFARFFFEPDQPRPVQEIDREIQQLEIQIQSALRALGDA
jgi:type I restriction enzyme M protein